MSQPSLAFVVPPAVLDRLYHVPRRGWSPFDAHALDCLRPLPRAVECGALEAMWLSLLEE